MRDLAISGLVDPHGYVPRVNLFPQLSETRAMPGLYVLSTVLVRA